MGMLEATLPVVEQQCRPLQAATGPQVCKLNTFPSPFPAHLQGAGAVTEGAGWLAPERTCCLDFQRGAGIILCPQMILSLSFKGQEENSKHGHREQRTFQEVMLGSDISTPAFSCLTMGGKARA